MIWVCYIGGFLHCDMVCERFMFNFFTLARCIPKPSSHCESGCFELMWVLVILLPWRYLWVARIMDIVIWNLRYSYYCISNFKKSNIFWKFGTKYNNSLINIKISYYIIYVGYGTNNWINLKGTESFAVHLFPSKVLRARKQHTECIIDVVWYTVLLTSSKLLINTTTNCR